MKNDDFLQLAERRKFTKNLHTVDQQLEKLVVHANTFNNQSGSKIDIKESWNCQ